MFPSDDDCADDCADDCGGAGERFPATGTGAGEPRVVPASPEADALAAAVDGVLAVDPDALSDAELRSAMVELRRTQSRLAAAITELTAAFDARRAWAEDGSRNAADWLSSHAHRPRREVASDVRVGRRLRGMPVVRDAWRAGDISAAHARVLARLAGHPRAGTHFADSEQMLTDDARDLRFDHFERAAQYWLQAADPDGPERDRQRDHELRRFSLPIGLDGVGHPEGHLTAMAAATVGSALERIERELFEADWADARARLGDAATAADLARTPAQRRHDSLVELAVRGSGGPADGKRPAPLVTVMVGYETFAGPVCELAGGTVVAPGDVAELLGRDDTLIRRAVFDAPDRLVELSESRTFRGTLRQLLEIRQRCCDHDTCHVPAHRCQGDHVVPWSQGGPTSQVNGRLQCGFHNRWSYANPPPTGGGPPADAGSADGRDPTLRAPRTRVRLGHETSDNARRAASDACTDPGAAATPPGRDPHDTCAGADTDETADGADAGVDPATCPCVRADRRNHRRRLAEAWAEERSRWYDIDVLEPGPGGGPNRRICVTARATRRSGSLR